MLSILIAAAAVAAASPIVAPAQPAPDTVRIHVADLDLTSPAGVKMLDRRIRRAANATCPSDSVVELARKMDLLACRRVFLAAASTQRDHFVAQAARRTTLAATTVPSAGE